MGIPITGKGYKQFAVARLGDRWPTDILPSLFADYLFRKNGCCPLVFLRHIFPLIRW